MEREPRPEAMNGPGWDVWLAGGLSTSALGLWLLRQDDPFLMALWGAGLLIIGTAATIIGLGIILRIWR